MTKSGLEGEKEAHAALVENFKQRGDFEMYSQLPDYEDFQVYDLGAGTILSRIAQKIYANFYNPSWGTLKHHLFVAKTQRSFLESSEILLKAIKGRSQTGMGVCGGIGNPDCEYF